MSPTSSTKTQLRCSLQSIGKEGVFALYKGLTAQYARIAPHTLLTFLFFEIALTIELPKGLTEPLFYPIYDLFY